MHLHLPVLSRLKSLLSRLSARLTQPATIFVCVKTRTDGRPCCAATGAAALLGELQSVIADNPAFASHLVARPSGCLDLCEQGVVAVAYSGASASRTKAAKRKRDRLLHPRLATITSATPADALAITQVVHERTAKAPQ